MSRRTSIAHRFRDGLLAGGAVLLAWGLGEQAVAQLVDRPANPPADQPAAESPSAVTGVPAAQPQALTIPPAAKKNWDRDKDGEVDRSEFTRFFGEAKLFSQFDHDGSGALEPDEFDRGLFSMIDSDGSATLTREEWIDADRWQRITPNGVFENFDDNHDGLIERAEFRALPAGNGEALFESWDRDGDGEIRPSELETFLFESIDFNERNPLLAVQDEDVPRNGADEDDVSASPQPETPDSSPGAPSAPRAAETERTPPGGGTVTDVMPDTGAEDVAAMPARCRDPLRRIHREMEALGGDASRDLGRQTEMKLDNLVRRAERFCDEGQVAQAMELIDNSEELLGLK